MPNKNDVIIYFVNRIKNNHRPYIAQIEAEKPIVKSKKMSKNIEFATNNVVYTIYTQVNQLLSLKKTKIKITLYDNIQFLW